MRDGKEKLKSFQIKLHIILFCKVYWEIKSNSNPTSFINQSGENKKLFLFVIYVLSNIIENKESTLFSVPIIFTCFRK